MQSFKGPFDYGSVALKYVLDSFNPAKHTPDFKDTETTPEYGTSKYLSPANTAGVDDLGLP